MTGKTHLVGGLAASAIYLMATRNGDFGAPDLNMVQSVISVPLVAAGSLLPDIDLRTSTVGQKAPALAWVVNTFLSHRTFFHSPLFLLILFMTVKTNIPFLLWIIIPVVVGAYSHLTLDMLNRSGIPLLWPIQTRFWLLGVKTGGVEEKLFCQVLLVLTAALWGRLLFQLL